MVLCFAIMTLLAIAVVFAAYPLVHVFDVAQGTPLEAYAVEWMRILGYAMPPAAINIALIGLLQGAGATRTSLRINIWATLGIQVPVALLLGFGLDLGEIGVWWSFPIAFVAKAGMNYLEMRRERWAVTGVRVSESL